MGSSKDPVGDPLDLPRAHGISMIHWILQRLWGSHRDLLDLWDWISYEIRLDLLRDRLDPLGSMSRSPWDLVGIRWISMGSNKDLMDLLLIHWITLGSTGSPGPMGSLWSTGSHLGIDWIAPGSVKPPGINWTSRLHGISPRYIGSPKDPWDLWDPVDPQFLWSTGSLWDV